MESIFTPGKTWRKGQYLHISDSVADELIKSGKGRLSEVSLIGLVEQETKKILEGGTESPLQEVPQTISSDKTANLEPGHYSKPKTERTSRKKKAPSEGE